MEVGSENHDCQISKIPLVEEVGSENHDCQISKIPLVEEVGSENHGEEISKIALVEIEDVNNETDVEELHYNSEVSIGRKRKREGKLRSDAWQHFTKMIKEDGTCERCQCNHCHKLFTCSSRSGTAHLNRHIKDGICPVFKKDKTVTVSNISRGNDLLSWKYNQSSTQQSMDNEAENLQPQPLRTVEDNFTTPTQTQTPMPLRCKLPQQSAMKFQPRGDLWMKEFKNCVAKLVELNNGRVPVLSPQPLAIKAPDYSVSVAVKCLNEMGDIPQSSEMYLDAFEILQDLGERECFICLPPGPRRRWLQRVLHRRYPSRYSSNT